MPPTPIALLAQKITESETFKERFAEVQINASAARLSFETDDLVEGKITKLLLQGSVLALSEEISHRSIAQKINALLHETKPDEELVNYAIQILSSRLGNYPVIDINSQVFGNNNLIRKLGENSVGTTTLDPEVIGNLYAEEEESRVQIREKIFHFNLFQKEILDALATKSLISFSAPTSFGKSFIVRHYIARRFADGSLRKVLIIVPTKSLIDDFYDGVQSLKKDLDLDFAIYTHARSVENAQEKSVFILTQERLTFLLDKNPDFARSFEVIYCDEAQYISRGYRGFVLRNVLRKIVNLCGIIGSNGSAQYIFTSPLIKNPQYYHDRFFQDLSDDQCFHKEVLYSPVEKNVHFVAKGQNDYSYFLFRDPTNEESFKDRLHEIGTRSFPLSLQNPENATDKQIATDIHIVLNSNLDARTILYTTSPLKAHQYAYELANNLPDKGTIPRTQLTDISRYIRDHYDESFGLIDLIKKGIGLHYGKMPIGLRRAMVNLFEDKHIDYLVCTSTLLEGVNLPAKNIFLFSNKHNGTHTHSTLSFWNLIGRAGRITYGLSGNVFCIADRPDRYRELFENKDAEIKDPESDVSENITKRNHVIKSFLEPENEFTYLTSPYRNEIEYLIYELLTTDLVGSILDRFNLSPEDRASLIVAINRHRELIVIPIDILKLNQGIDPRLQNKLLTILGQLTLLELRDLFEIASNPLSANKLNLKKILNKTADTLRWPLTNSKFDFIDATAGRIAQWLHEVSISEFIQQVLQYHQDKPQLEKISKALDMVERLDTDLSYSAPKYIKCFFDLALYDASTRGMVDVNTYFEKVEAFLFSIESGISSSIGRFLFERGVSRPIAIKVNTLVEEMGEGPISINFFERPDVLARLREGLSSIAFDELAEHLKA